MFMASYDLRFAAIGQGSLYVRQTGDVISMPSIGLEVWGKRAFFRRPDKGDVNISYDFIPPMMCRWIFESIYWHPSVVYFFDEIRILSPIRYEKTEVENEKAWSYDEAHYSVMALCDVHYLILAHPRLVNNHADNMNISKVMGMFKDRAKRGKHRRMKKPFFGINSPDFMVHFRWVDPHDDLEQYKGIQRTEKPGLMVFDQYDMNGRKSRIWFHPEVKQGVISLKNITIEQDGEEKIFNRGGDYR